jgi:hypothetical protein
MEIDLFNIRNKNQPDALEHAKPCDGTCNYCGRHFATPSLKRSGDFFVCIDTDDCLAYQNDSIHQENDSASTDITTSESSTIKENDNNNEVQQRDCKEKINDAISNLQNVLNS